MTIFHIGELPRANDFAMMEAMLLRSGLFHETWQNKQGQSLITCGGEGMDVASVFDGESGQLMKIEKLEKQS